MPDRRIFPSRATTRRPCRSVRRGRPPGSAATNSRSAGRRTTERLRPPPSRSWRCGHLVARDPECSLGRAASAPDRRTRTTATPAKAGVMLALARALPSRPWQASVTHRPRVPLLPQSDSAAMRRGTRTAAAGACPREQRRPGERGVSRTAPLVEKRRPASPLVWSGTPRGLLPVLENRRCAIGVDVVAAEECLEWGPRRL